jgi:hypothetical protein
MDTNIPVSGGKKISIIFLQGVLVFVGIGVLAFMLWEPHLEGRNINASAFEIYFKDPFLAYVYIASISFFVGLYNAFKALSYVRQNKIFSEATVKALRTIKYSASLLSILIVLAALYIRIFHAQDDDPAGFIALCIVTTFISIVVATVAAVFGRVVQKGVDLKQENELVV